MNAMKAWSAVGAAILVAGAILVGCETTTSEDNLITVTPASATLTNDYQSVVLTASTDSTNTVLALPLVWSVSNAERGRITASGSMTAVYECTRLGGPNTVTVRDQGDNEGTAIISH